MLFLQNFTLLSWTTTQNFCLTQYTSGTKRDEITKQIFPLNSMCVCIKSPFLLHVAAKPLPFLIVSCECLWHARGVSMLNYHSNQAWQNKVIFNSRNTTWMLLYLLLSRWQLGGHLQRICKNKCQDGYSLVKGTIFGNAMLSKYVWCPFDINKRIAK